MVGGDDGDDDDDSSPHAVSLWTISAPTKEGRKGKADAPAFKN